MGKVAAEAGAAPMSLYRHVSGKESCSGTWWTRPGGQTPAVRAGEGWRTGWPAAPGPSGTRPAAPVGGPRPAAAACRSCPARWPGSTDALACLRGTGLTEARKASVIMLLAGYVSNMATTEADVMAAVVRLRAGPA